MTVLEVFKHDPLYAWCVNSFTPLVFSCPFWRCLRCLLEHSSDPIRRAGDAEKMQRAQGGARSDVLQQTASVQEKADRVLSRIRSKLRDDLSVEYAVNALIQQARDPENLARIFTGWHSWF
jgi:ataxia telangiectasia mutated family protein